MTIIEVNEQDIFPLIENAKRVATLAKFNDILAELKHSITSNSTEEILKFYGGELSLKDIDFMYSKVGLILGKALEALHSDMKELEEKKEIPSTH